MKKLFLSFVVLLAGCVSYTVFHDNENCIGTREFKILQALNNGALAYECTIWDGCSSFNQLVFVDWLLDIDYYDDMVFKIPSNKCAVRNGVYTYTNRENIRKTVPAIRFEFKDNPKSKEDFVERFEDSYKKMYTACLHSSQESDNVKDSKFCECYTTEYVKYVNTLDFDMDNFSYTVLNKNVKKECGKLPKYVPSDD